MDESIIERKAFDITFKNGTYLLDAIALAQAYANTGMGPIQFSFNGIKLVVNFGMSEKEVVETYDRALRNNKRDTYFNVMRSKHY